MRTVEVRAASGSYQVLIGSGLLPRLGEIVAPLFPLPVRSVHVVSCGMVLGAAARDALASMRRSLGCESAQTSRGFGERDKTLESVGAISAALARARHERNDPVVVIGGGVLGDIAGFAAAIYRRGVPWVNCPTTLLAMVDASVGGKTGVNLAVSGDGSGRVLKNMVGAFHPPRLVVADVDVLRTLPDRELRCGLAECIKHGMIAADFGDGALLDWTEANLDRVLAREPGALEELIARNVALKAAVVGEDEREEAPDEAGGRALLNLGHTFGHAIETLPGLSLAGGKVECLLHGEAVSLGLVAACAAAAELGMIDAPYAARIAALLQRASLPTTISGLPDTQILIAALTHDKKTRAGKVRLVLPSGLGRARVVSDPPRPALQNAFGAIAAAH